MRRNVPTYLQHNMSVREAPLLKFRHLDHIHNLTEPLADEFKGKLDLSMEDTADNNGDV